MRAADFDLLLNHRLERIVSTLASKAGEYASNDDRLHNFKRAAELRDKDPKDVLLGMLVKHWVSIEDLVNTENQYLMETVDEKIGDAINYLILLEAHLKEHLYIKQKPSPSQ